MSGLLSEPPLLEVATCASVANAYRMWTPGSSAGAVALNVFPPVLAAVDHGPCQVSTWYSTPSIAGAVGLKLDMAVRVNVGVAEPVVLVPKGSIATSSGTLCVTSGAITVTLRSPPT